MTAATAASLWIILENVLSITSLLLVVMSAIQTTRILHTGIPLTAYQTTRRWRWITLCRVRRDQKRTSMRRITALREVHRVSCCRFIAVIVSGSRLLALVLLWLRGCLWLIIVAGIVTTTATTTTDIFPAYQKWSDMSLRLFHCC